MLSVKTNKEFTEFSKDFMGGFGFKQSISIIAGVVIGILIMCSLIFFTGVPIVVTPYIAMPFIAVPIVSAFYKKDGLGFLAHRKKLKQFRNQKACIYISTETAASYNKYLVEQEKKEEANSDDSFNKLIKKLIIIGIIVGVLIIGGIAALVIYKFA